MATSSTTTPPTQEADTRQPVPPSAPLNSYHLVLLFGLIVAWFELVSVIDAPIAPAPASTDHVMALLTRASGRLFTLWIGWLTAGFNEPTHQFVRRTVEGPKVFVMTTFGSLLAFNLLFIANSLTAQPKFLANDVFYVCFSIVTLVRLNKVWHNTPDLEHVTVEKKKTV